MESALKKISVNGGAAVPLCSTDTVFGMSWGEDGIIFGQGSQGIMRVSDNGGKPELLVSVKAGELAYGPQMLPGGQTVLFTLANANAAGVTGSDQWDKAQVVVQSLKSDERKTIIEGGSDGRYLPTRHIIYALGRTLFAVPFNTRRLERTGGPVPIVEGVSRSNFTGAAQFAFSQNGSLIYIPPGPATAAQNDLAFVDRKGNVEPLGLPPGAYEYPRVSPDGKRVAFERIDDSKDASIWTYNLSGASSAQKLTIGGRNRYPIWSADNQWIAFQSDREGDLGIFRQKAEGTGSAERLTQAEQGAAHVPESWSPKADRFLFSAYKDSTFSLMIFSLQDRKAALFGNVQSSARPNAVFSPDGDWVAYQSNDTGKSELYAQPFPATGEKHQIQKSVGPAMQYPLWSPDGKELFYTPVLGRIVVIPVTTRPSFTFGNPLPGIFPTPGIAFGGTNLIASPNSGKRPFDVTPDGRLLVVTAAGLSANTSAASAPPHIQVVVNWFEDVKHRMSSR